MSLKATSKPSTILHYENFLQHKDPDVAPGMEAITGDRVAGLISKSQNLAYLERLLNAMEEQTLHTSLDAAGSGYEEEDVSQGSPVGEAKRIKSEIRPPPPTIAASDPGDLRAKRETLERLIRTRCDTLAEHLCGSVFEFFVAPREGGGKAERLCGSVSDFFGRQPAPREGGGNVEHLCGSVSEFFAAPREGGGTRKARRSRFSWNAQLSRVGEDLDAVRRLICPEREGDREDAVGAAASAGVDVSVTEAKTMLGDINRLIARQHWVEQEAGRRGSRPARGRHGELVEATPCRGELRREGCAPPQPPPTQSDVITARRAEGPTRNPKLFTSLPDGTRAAATSYNEASATPRDNDDGKKTMPVRIDLKEVVKRHHSPLITPNTSAPWKQCRVSKPLVSKHPQLATILEERDIKMMETTTPLSSSRIPTAIPNGAHPVTPQQQQQQQCGAVVSRRCEEEPTNQRKTTGSFRLRATRSSSGGSREDPSPSPGGSENVREASCPLGDIRNWGRAADEAARGRVSDSRSDTTTCGGRRAEGAAREEAVRGYDESRTRPREAGPAEDNGENSSAEEGAERNGATLRDIKLEEYVKLVEEVTRVERSHSTPDVARHQRSWLTRAHQEGGENNTDSPGDVTSGHDSEGLSILASLDEKLNHEQELVVLLWMCDLSERLEKRSREATNRMRRAVSVGDATLTKLRLLKGSLVNSNSEVTVQGDSP